MKKHLIGIVALGGVLTFTAYYALGSHIKHPYTQEYVVGVGNIQGDVDIEYFKSLDKRFEIGADKTGKAVFKDPKAAYAALIENYSEGIALIQEEFHLGRLSQRNYGEYGTYGWQVTGGSELARNQANFVSSFFDIYENSF